MSLSHSFNSLMYLIRTPEAAPMIVVAAAILAKKPTGDLAVALAGAEAFTALMSSHPAMDAHDKAIIAGIVGQGLVPLKITEDEAHAAVAAASKDEAGNSIAPPDELVKAAAKAHKEHVTAEAAVKVALAAAA